MGILNLQKFIVAYVRDVKVREDFTQSPGDYYDNFDLSPSEKELASQIDYSILRVTAEKMSKDRMDRRESEFQELFHVLRALGEHKRFSEEFVRSYPSGSLTRKVETERLVEFSKQYIRERNLPEILIELVDYSELAANMTFFPKESRRENAASLDKSKKLYLKKPYAIKEFHFDLVELVNSTEISIDRLREYPSTRQKLFFQKSYISSLSSLVLEIDDDKFFDLLEQNHSYNEILQQAASEDIQSEWAQNIEYLYQENIIGTL